MTGPGAGRPTGRSGGAGPSGPATEDVIEARRLLAEAGSVIVLTGAGISADSGVPTFRGSGGLWRSHRAEDLATPEAFARDPRLVWEWYGWRRATVAACEPNAAHLAVARWAAADAGVTVVTQNVDGLHELALARVRSDGQDDAGDRGSADRGTSARSGAPAGAADRAAAGGGTILALHGTLFGTRCTGCGERRPDRAEIDATSRETLPSCEGCASLLRPDVVWFGEALDPGVLRGAFELAEAADVCLVVGTSAVVQPAASLAAVTRRAGGRVVEVNPAETPLTSLAAVSLRGGAADVVPRIAPPGDPRP